MKKGACIISDINESELKKHAKELSCSIINLDVTSLKTQWLQLNKLKMKAGSLNILVNNAGIGNGGDVE